ncbi:MAG: hypothetical protein IKX76_06880, partial [Eubacterium sp.]|nr:hypothetical protein [Eubacterium sp.]
EVCDFLRDQGFTVDTRVGYSGYKIDLGIRKPDSENYLMAIECDGAAYHQLKNARDRDSLRRRVLENMGWRYYRIWSTDWYRNKQVEKDRLLRTIQETIREEANPISDDTGKPENGAPAVGEAVQTKMNKNDSPDDLQSVRDRFVIELEKSPLTFQEYKEVDAEKIILNHNFDYPRAVREILETEAPLSEEYLLKRIVKLFGREKVTKTVLQYFNSRMTDARSEGIIRRNGFLYLQGVHEYRLRIPGDKREIKYISIEELAVGLYILIKHNVTASREGLYKTLINLLGFSRSGDAIVFRLDEALAKLIHVGLIKEEDGAYSLETKKDTSTK